MKTKFGFGRILAVLAISSFVMGCSPEERVEVFGDLFGDRTRLEKQCVASAMSRARSVVVQGDAAATAKNLRQISLRYCPADFNEAATAAILSIEHIAALQTDRRKLESASGGAVVASLFGFNSVADAHSRNVRDFNARLRSASSRYEAALDEVEMVAARYGVRERLPR